MTKWWNQEYNNVDDKKELFNLLANYLDDKGRKEFLEWACKQVNTNMGFVLRPGKESTYHPKEVFWQLELLSQCHHLDLNDVLPELVSRARKK